LLVLEYSVYVRMNVASDQAQGSGKVSEKQNECLDKKKGSSLTKVT